MLQARSNTCPPENVAARSIIIHILQSFGGVVDQSHRRFGRAVARKEVNNKGGIIYNAIKVEVHRATAVRTTSNTTKSEWDMRQNGAASSGGQAMPRVQARHGEAYH